MARGADGAGAMSDETRGAGPRRWSEHTVRGDEAGRTVQEILTGTMGISRRMIQRLTRGKGILVNRRPGFLARPVKAGDVVAARLAQEEDPGLEPVAMELHVVHEDRDVLVLDKPPHLLVHPTSPEHVRTLSHGIAHHFMVQGVVAKVRPVHRIDRDTSGLLLVAKSGFAHQHLDRQLRERGLRREYLAFVHGLIADDEGTIDAPIGKHRLNPSLRAVRPGGEEARTRFRVRERYADATLAEVELETGRTHQIRVHMAHLGHPVFGDRSYGAPRADLVRRQALHASRLSFVHPSTSEALTFEAPLPDDLVELQARLRATVSG
jgi:RluA family pseudouridine synthase